MRTIESILFLVKLRMGYVLYPWYGFKCLENGCRSHNVFCRYFSAVEGALQGDDEACKKG